MQWSVIGDSVLGDGAFLAGENLNQMEDEHMLAKARWLVMHAIFTNPHSIKIQELIHDLMFTKKYRVSISEVI